MILLAALMLLQQEAAPEILVTARPKPFDQTPATMVVEPVAMMIAACDADGDGETTRIEMETGVRRSFEAIDTAKSGKLRYIAFADWAERWLGDRNALPSPFDVDRDADGAVTLQELQDHFSRLFSRFDRDRDGAINRAEILTIRTTPADANGPQKPLAPNGKDRKRDKK
ncbi:MAG: EF-hand domain-containing protein [Sphingomonas sp.]|jgi:Ca2+-binding EF-hand superfamily protein|uniref:EF-hand domain-containing protein n=1 Tax=Sphingomonas longa TaxID=2778730 RepID=A0ABS2D4F3_9SPHN|nr:MULTISPECIES: EF-hand domain-containing protein [Alphaproteobacteria]MBM6575795.1 EF-hand domain-containing protein [Sphingomonas sp. BT552]MBR7708842.1 EF-hand domain-containing protein [Microvirga sp. SRT01]RZM23799.1 MAG: EF-hand domain-containing protein [Sphingomonas sp.]